MGGKRGFVLRRGAGMWRGVAPGGAVWRAGLGFDFENTVHCRAFSCIGVGMGGGDGARERAKDGVLGACAWCLYLLVGWCAFGTFGVGRVGEKWGFCGGNEGYFFIFGLGGGARGGS